MQCTHWDGFFPLLKTVFELDFNIFLSGSAGFCFTSSTSTKHFLLRTFFIWGQKTFAQSEIRWIGRVGCGVMLSWIKSWWTFSPVWAGVLVNHPLWMVKSIGRVFQTNSLKSNRASHNNDSWYTDTDGFLEHSPSGGNLYYKGPAP